MPSFKDNSQREWTIAIDAKSILQVREECEPRFMLNDRPDDNTFMRLQDDPALLCQVLYVLCKKQIQERGLDQEQFYMGVIGDAIDVATEAMLQAIVSFTPRRSRELMEVCAVKQNKIQQVATERVLSRINDPELEAKILENLDQQLDDAINKALMPPKSATNGQGQ